PIQWIVWPLKTAIATPSRNYDVNPRRHLLGLETDPVRDTTLDAWTEQAAKALTIETRPGSNVITVVYDFPDPVQGTRFVERLLANYLLNRQMLQSNDLPQHFYEQKKAQYEQRPDDQEAQRLGRAHV